MLNMACTLFRLTPEEALRGVTQHAARALGLTDRGQLIAGQRADFVVWQAEHPRELAYWFGRNPCQRVVVAGRERTSSHISERTTLQNMTAHHTSTRSNCTGQQPLLISLPHVGTEIPLDQQSRFRPEALQVADTDWHLEALYAFARELGASVLVPRYSRYLIDLNRPPENQPMYPGVNNTELCPTRAFSGEATLPRRPGARRRRGAAPHHPPLVALPPGLGR
jgi:hypothetical protein